MKRGDCAKKLPVRLIGDPARLRQILINLLSNAIKFTPSGEISVEVGLADAGMILLGLLNLILLGEFK